MSRFVCYAILACGAVLGGAVRAAPPPRQGSGVPHADDLPCSDAPAPPTAQARPFQRLARLPNVDNGGGEHRPPAGSAAPRQRPARPSRTPSTHLQSAHVGPPQGPRRGADVVSYRVGRPCATRPAIYASPASGSAAVGSLAPLQAEAVELSQARAPSISQDGDGTNTAPAWDGEPLQDPDDLSTVQYELRPISYWFDHARVGYDHGFVIASSRDLDLETSDIPFQLRINGWGQLRHVILNSDGPNPDLNQFQLKRGRIIFSGHAFTPDFFYYIQIDGRSSSGDDVRLLDYVLTYDLGHHLWCYDRGTIGFKTGKYKMPFSLARYMTGREFEFTDRSMASMYFDVNRSLAWGLYGSVGDSRIPVDWEIAIFNGLVTGGAETGSSGSLDNNFAYSARIFAYPFGEWGDAELADLSYHTSPAARVGTTFAFTTIDKSGTTEFNQIRVVDSGETLASILPPAVDSYRVALYAMDAGWKFRGLSLTMEYYLRYADGFRGAMVPGLFDHGLWLQLGYFVIPTKLELLARWSRVAGTSGTLGVANESSDEVAGGLVWYFNGQHAKATVDITRLNGAPINSASLDIFPGEEGWLYRSQIQFSF